MAVSAVPCPSMLSPLIVTIALAGAVTRRTVPVARERLASTPRGTVISTGFEIVAAVPSSPESSTVTVP